MAPRAKNWAGREDPAIRREVRLVAAVASAVLAVLATASAPASAGPAHVVLDPGHGGSNTGTYGHGVHEKHLTLILSNLVAERLRQRGIEVTLTRTRDRTLTLRQRIALANRVAADLFVSIHANASPTKAQRGYETFVLSARAVDVDGRALRAATGAQRPGLDPQTAHVLDDVERGAAQHGSADLASRIQRALRELRGHAGDRGVRQDAHHVLLGATMPAVLVEVGFLDHAIEGKELLSPETQREIADALANALAGHLTPSSP